MSDAEKITPARLMASNIESLLEFADQQGDFVLGAKLADVQDVFLKRYFPSKSA